MKIKQFLLLFVFSFYYSCTPIFLFAQEIYFLENDCNTPNSFLRQLPPQITKNKSIYTDLKSLFSCYEGQCIGIEIRGRDDLYIIMKDSVYLLYDDGLDKVFEDKLNNPDLEDSFYQIYNPGTILEEFRFDYDPGRFRVEGFFNSIYGINSKAVEANLEQVDFCGKKVLFNSKNGASRALEKVGIELMGLIEKRPDLRKYIFPLGGTFYWRTIDGTKRLSAHSWAIAIDLNSKYGSYWRWTNNKSSDAIIKLKKLYPMEIVRIFERNGFIWGGKWSHFDLMHFEYRPELIYKSKLLSNIPDS
jgi:D-alanyl-D-alanine carboxypeptidase